MIAVEQDAGVGTIGIMSEPTEKSPPTADDPAPGEVCPLVQRPPEGLAEAFFAAGDDQIKARLRVLDDGRIEIVVYAPNAPLVEKALADLPPGLVRFELCG